MSFDIDGTLEHGDPPGPITVAFVRSLCDQGFILGSCSDRTLTEQRLVWSRLRLAPDFVAGKTQLPDVRRQFMADFYVHIGDTVIDELYAKEAGFDFWWSWDVQLSDLCSRSL